MDGNTTREVCHTGQCPIKSARQLLLVLYSLRLCAGYYFVYTETINFSSYVAVVSLYLLKNNPLKKLSHKYMFTNDDCFSALGDACMWVPMDSNTTREVYHTEQYPIKSARQLLLVLYSLCAGYYFVYTETINFSSYVAVVPLYLLK